MKQDDAYMIDDVWYCADGTRIGTQGRMFLDEWKDAETRLEEPSEDVELWERPAEKRVSVVSESLPIF